MYFKEIIGQQAVKTHLIKTVKQGHVSHALMFTGGVGNGKLPLALAFAGYIFCENRGETDRCGKCGACKKMDVLGHPDLHFSFPFVKTTSIKTCNPQMREFISTISKDPYLDLRDWELQIASDNKQSIITADESNEIVKRLTLKSFAGGHKILIIWNADKLNSSAQNKLLKTLEEPEAKTLIILVTDSAQNLLPTINSRTQLVQCEHISDEVMATALVERFDTDKTNALNIAKIADGDFAKAKKMIAANQSTSKYFELFSQWMRAAAVSDYYKILTSCDQISKLSRDEQQNFLEYGLQFFHQSILYTYVGKEQARFDSEAAGFAIRFAPFMVANDLVGFHDIFSDGHYMVKRNVNAHLLFMKMGSDMAKLFKTRTPQHNS